MKLLLKRVALLLFLLGALPVGAKNYYFRHYQNEDGLSHNTILSCVQDKQGFLWFGTRDGLNRFDGRQFATFYSITPPDLVVANEVNRLCEDEEERIWMATLRGLYYYDKRAGVFHAFSAEEYTSKRTIIDVLIDAQNRIWFTDSSGLYRYDPVRKKTAFFPRRDDFIPRYLCQTGKGELWISSYEGNIYKYIECDEDFQGHKILGQEEVNESVWLNKMIEDEKGRIIVCTNKAGIRVFDPSAGSVATLFVRDKMNNEMVINAILISRDYLWIGADNGLYQYNDEEGLSPPMTSEIGNPYALTDKGIRSLYEDKEGGIWIGTYYGGLNYLPSEKLTFEKFVPSFQAGHIQGKIVRAINKDVQGNIWIGTEDNGVCCYNPSANAFTNYPIHSNVQTLAVDGDRLWIGSYTHGIYLMDLKSRKITRPNFYSLRNGFVVSILRTSDGSIYAGTIFGLHRYNAATNDMERLDRENLRCFVHCLYEGSDGTLWIGTYGQGLYAYRRDDQSFVRYRYDVADESSISANIITSIMEDSHRQIWLTTAGNGFCKMNKDGTFERYMVKERFPYGVTCAMAEDAKGYLWITSTKGLVRFNPHTSEYDIFHKSDGLTDNQFCYNSKYTDANGKIYFGTINGMVAFDPLELKESQYATDVFITGFTAIGSDEDHTEEGKSILYTRKITLSYDQASFCLNFVAPSFTNPEQTKYRYILEDYDKEWNYLSDNRSIYYTNVSPGKYKLKIAASDINDDWSTHETSIDLVITPPWEKSNMAYIIYTILVTVILVWAYKVYTKRKNLKQLQMLENLENQKEKELYNAKIHFFTNITHEVRTPLTLIKAPLDKILKSDNLPGFMANNLSIMKHNVDRLLSLINQLLDFRKTEMEMIQLSLVSTDIGELIKRTVSRFMPSMEDTHKKVVLHIPDEAHTLAIDPEIVTKILSNLLSNALKYSKDYVEISIELPAENPSMTYIRINTNGEAIPADKREDIFKPFYQIEKNPLNRTKKGSGLGLALARSLTELHHGKLFVDPQIKSMNSFVLALSNEQKENVTVKNTETVMPNDIAKGEEQAENGFFTILIVDDEKEMAQFIADELATEYNTFIAYNGQQAIGLLQEEQVHIVVSDMLMPVMDGCALCNYIKSSPDYCHIPVILLTASVALNSRITGLKSGADGYIEKPFAIELLLEQIKNIFKNKELASKNFISTPLSNYRAITVNKMDDDFMKRMHAIILANLSNSNFSVEELASSLNTSLSTLFRKVKAITLLGPQEYIKLYRLKKAAEMLVEENYKINEIAYMFGFSSSSYFSTSFQKQFNMTPSEFIRQQKNEVPQV